MSTARSLQDLSKRAPSPHGAVLPNNSISQDFPYGSPTSQVLKPLVTKARDIFLNLYGGWQECLCHLGMPLGHRADRLKYKVRVRTQNTWTAKTGYRPDIEVKRNRLFDLELLSSPGKLKYAVLGSVLVVLHQLTVQKPARGELARRRQQLTTPPHSALSLGRGKKRPHGTQLSASQGEERLGSSPWETSASYKR